MLARLMLLAGFMAVDTFTGIALMQASQPVAMRPHPGWGPNPLADTQAGGIMWVVGDGIMVVLTVVLFAAWAGQPERPHLRGGWLERVRLATFEDHTRFTRPLTAGQARHVDLDTDEASWQAYNAWLTRLAGQSSPRRVLTRTRPTVEHDLRNVLEFVCAPSHVGGSQQY